MLLRWGRFSKFLENKFMTKILIATGIFSPDIGGPATYSQLLLNELSGKKLNFTVLTYSDRLGNNDYEAVFRTLRFWPIGLRHLLYFFYCLWLGRDQDVIYALDTVSAGLPSFWVARLLRKKFIVRVVGDFAWEEGVRHFRVVDNMDEFQNRSQGLFVESLRYLQKKVFHGADLIQVPSLYIKGIVLGWGVTEGRIRVIYNSCDSIHVERPRTAMRQDLGLSEDDVVIVSSGRLVPWKGFEKLIEVMGEMSREYKARLYIIGQGPDFSKLDQQIKEKNLRDRVFLIGALKKKDLAGYLKAADVFVLNTNYEGFSHQILEAMTLGVPVITTGVGGNPELISDGVDGLLVEFNNQAMLEGKIKLLMEDKKLRQRLSAAALKKSQLFSTDKMLKEVEGLLVIV